MAARVAAAIPCLLLLPLLLVAAVSGATVQPSAGYDVADLRPISRKSFPNEFVFGTASSAYQYEGVVKEGGRGPCIWDTFIREKPYLIIDQSNADVAVNSYHLYKEDVRIKKDMGMDAYRFSISWSRILPTGSLSGGINREGVNYYNNLINELLSKGMQPYATLFHWDTPQALEGKYGGFLSRNITDDFKDYAEVCFKEFGDRVRHSITFNEPHTYCNAGYATGTNAPGRCSPWEMAKCSIGNSATEPYIAAHNLLLAHMKAFRLYRRKYHAVQQGNIGITLNSLWFLPYSNSTTSDEGAARRAIDFMLGWFLEPIVRGHYPRSMRGLVGSRLPRFSREESHLIKHSFDFIGINYYTSNYALHLSHSNGLKVSYTTDALANLTGFRDLLMYVKDHYDNPTIYITENGVDEKSNKSLTLQEALKDDHRVDYHHRHLLAMLSAIRDGANVKGYFAWSLLDNFEWGYGHSIRLGLNFVDYDDGYKRYPKKSARWFKEILSK